MKKIKVLFIGVGSIAKRHICNLKMIAKEKGFSVRIDAFRHSTNSTKISEVFYEYHEKGEVPDDYDIVFITNPTERHLSALKDFHNKGNHFFIEKPVVSEKQIAEAEDFPLRENSLYYVACPLRYNPVIQFIKDNIQMEDVISVRSISSSYLPDWRPNQDYRQTYSAHKELGGGVSIDLIHEWDYLTYLFGWPEKLCTMIGKKSDLEISSDDYAIYIAEYPNMIAELHLDYFGRKTIREIQLIAKDETIIGDLVNNKIFFLNSGREIDFQEERDDFQKRELVHFIDMISGNTSLDDGFAHGLKVLKLTQGII